MLRIDVIDKGHAQLETLRGLFREYNDYLGFNLDFQGFEQELAALPGKYAAPSGRLYLATYNGEIAGCVAFYKLSEGICELKRLYTRPAFQGKGIGRALIERALTDAKSTGYRTMRLDSLRRLVSAGKIYENFGFSEISAYNVNPLDDVYYMERVL